MSTSSTGNLAENAVSSELVKLGYKIIEQNWKTKFAEIDIVAEKNNRLYFVEVKYRRTENAGDGLDYITQTKLHHMQRAAEAYVSSHDWSGEYELLAVSAVGSFDQLEFKLVEI